VRRDTASSWVVMAASNGCWRGIRVWL
jgi:hypothetical protein